MSEEQEAVNILFLGESGCGKSTLINAIQSYLTNKTIDDAIRNILNPLIPFSFIQQTSDMEDQTVAFGDINGTETDLPTGSSVTRTCSSYLFKFRNRIFRIIDTPGVVDTDGFEQDMRNLQITANYISQFKHINGVCLVMKPDEKRATIQMRYCFNELLKHLDKSVRENIIFVFTYGRSTFFRPGNTSRILKKLLNDYETEYHLHLNFDESNSFFFDNEAFRYVAMRKKGIEVEDLMKRSSYESWESSITQLARLLNYVGNKPKCPIDETLNLFDAERIIRKLPRPIANILKLIQDNLEFGMNFKEKFVQDPNIEKEGVPQIRSVVSKLLHPRTVCSGENCCRIIEENNERRIHFDTICHDQCYLHGVAQEVIGDEKLDSCEIMDHENNECTKCKCSYEKHLHITYEYKTKIEHVRSLGEIDTYISELREELKIITDINGKLNLFLQANSLLPINNAIVEYLKHFLQLEKKARKNNRAALSHIEKLIKDIGDMNEKTKKIIEELDENPQSHEIPDSTEVTFLIRQLYNLPINGEMIRQQVNGIGNFERAKPLTEKTIEISEGRCDQKLVDALDRFH